MRRPHAITALPADQLDSLVSVLDAVRSASATTVLRSPGSRVWDATW